MKMRVLAAAAALLIPGAASAADLSGAWKLEVNIADMKVPVACNITQSGSALTGTCNRTDAEEKPAQLTGTVDGAKATWAYDIDFGGQPLHLSYTGNLASDTQMSGAVEVAGAGSGTFTGTKS